MKIIQVLVIVFLFLGLTDKEHHVLAKDVQYLDGAETFEGRTLLPVRKIFENLGAKVDWNQSTETVTASKGEKIITLKVNSKSAKINNSVKNLDVAPRVINGNTMIPVRFVGEALGAKVEWNSNLELVTIVTADREIYVGKKNIEIIKHINQVTNDNALLLFNLYSQKPTKEEVNKFLGEPIECYEPEGDGFGIPSCLYPNEIAIVFIENKLFSIHIKSFPDKKFGDGDFQDYDIIHEYIGYGYNIGDFSVTLWSNWDEPKQFMDLSIWDSAKLLSQDDMENLVYNYVKDDGLSYITYNFTKQDDGLYYVKVYGDSAKMHTYKELLINPFTGFIEEIIN